MSESVPVGDTGHFDPVKALADALPSSVSPDARRRILAEASEYAEARRLRARAEAAEAKLAAIRDALDHGGTLTTLTLGETIGKITAIVDGGGT